MFNPKYIFMNNIFMKSCLINNKLMIKNKNKKKWEKKILKIYEQYFDYFYAIVLLINS